METSLTFVKFFCFLVLVVVWNNEVCVEAGGTFDVTKYGAVSNGKTDSSKAFLDAWKAACMAGGTMLIPKAGGTFKVNSLAGKGGCRGEVTVQVDGVVKASNGNNRYDSWFSFHHVHGLTINGSGTLDGNGHSAWGKGPGLARSLALYGCTNVYVEGITLLNSKGFHFAIAGSKTITFKHVTIKAPVDSPNTDGIHIQGSDSVQIISSPIGTGDDCISIGQGSTNINITGVDCGPGHGFSIGSIGKQKNEKDVRGVHIENSSVTGTQNGVRIKTWSPSPSSVSVYDVTFQDITVNNAKYPVVIDQHYCGGHKDCDRDSSRVQVSKVKFNSIKGTSASQLAVKLDCSESKPCQGIEMDNINLRLNDGGKTTSKCDNANVTYSGPQNPPACRS